MEADDTEGIEPDTQRVRLAITASQIWTQAQDGNYSVGGSSGIPDMHR